MVLSNSTKRPVYAVYLFLLLGTYFAGKHDVTKTIAGITLAVCMYIYCDYKTGDDVGWERKRFKQKARTITGES